MSDFLEKVGIAVVAVAVGVAIGMKIKKTSEETPEEKTEKTNKVIEFAKQNKEFVIGAASVLVVGAKEAHKVIRDIRRSIEERNRKRRIYDHSSGKWIPLLREMTPYEHVEFDSRRRNGETASQILYDMGLLR